MREMFTIGIGVLVMWGGLGLIMSEPVNAQYVPVASLEFETIVQYVDVSPSSDGTAIFNGTLYVECDYSTITEFTVTGSATTENWIITISPSAVSLPSGANEENVNVIVRVPLGTSADVAGSITVDGTTITTTPISYSTCFSNQVAVVVNPYYMFSVSCSEPYKETTPSSNVSFVLQITNQGNTIIDDLHLDVENKDELSNWTVIFPSSYLQIDEKETKNATVNVITPQEINYASQKITINISSTQANLFENYSIYVRLVYLIKNFSPLTNPTMNEAENITFSVILSDVSDIVINWYLNKEILPENSSTYTFLSDYNSAGTYNITVIVSSGTLTEDHTWILTVTNVSKKPTAIISSPSNNAEFTTKDNIYFDATGSSDPDNDSLTYTWTSNIDGNIGNSATFSKKLSSGTHTITLTIEDGNGGTDTKQITITVNKSSEKKGLIPGFEAFILLIVLAGCVAVGIRRRKKGVVPPEKPG